MIKDNLNRFIAKHSVYLFIHTALALASILVIIFWKSNAIAINIACSILASAIVGFITVLFLAQEDEERKVTRDWGLGSIYSSRSDMNADCAQDLSRAKEHIDYIGFGFHSLREMKTDVIKEKLAAGVKIRFLVMSPESPYIAVREKEEDVSPDSIKKTIEDLEDWVIELNKDSRKNHIELKYYNSLPLDYYNRIDNVVYMGPYWYGKTSQHTVSYRFKGDSNGYDLYTKYFEDLWNNGKLAKDALSKRVKRK